MALSLLVENLAQVRARIEDAARRSGRGADEITLVAVTKYVEIEIARALVEAGCTDLGESRPQELWRKAEQMSDLAVGWHLIGHLQRNKVKRTLDYAGWIQSTDSVRLLETLEEQNDGRSLRLPVLIEVNISGDTEKHGFTPQELEGLLPRLGKFSRLEVRGLMCMASLTGDRDRARKDFANLRLLRDRLRSECPEGVSLEELSMGMSRDYDVAILEGATIVRVVSALFEGVRP